MSKFIFNLILSISISIQCYACDSTVNRTVQHEENVTLSCHVNSSSTIAWYWLGAEKMTLLISATKGNIHPKGFIVDYNKDKNVFQLQEGNTSESVSLTIIRVGEDGIGLYYCAFRIIGRGMQFSTPVRLTFADATQGGFSFKTESVVCSTLSIFAYAACGLCSIICTIVLCAREGSPVMLCMGCVRDSKAAEMQYASLRFVRPSRAPVPESVNVTYATVAHQTS